MLKSGRRSCSTSKEAHEEMTLVFPQVSLFALRNSEYFAWCADEYDIQFENHGDKWVVDL